MHISTTRRQVDCTNLCDEDPYIATENPSLEIPKLIEWLGWEWDDNFLKPQNNKRNVFTASSLQVRNKINKKGIGNWKKYQEILKPAIELIKKSKLLEDI